MDAKTLAILFISIYSFLYFIFLVSYIYIISKGKEYGRKITIYSYVLFIISLGGLTINYYLFETGTNIFDENVDNKRLIQKIKLFIIILFLNLLSIYFGYKMKTFTTKISDNRNRLLLLLACFTVYMILITIYLVHLYFINYKTEQVKQLLDDKTTNEDEKKNIRREEITDDFYK